MNSQMSTHTTTGTVVLSPNRGGSSVWTHSASVSGTGAVAATVVVEGSPDEAGANPSDWYTVCTLDLSGTTSASDAFSGLNVPAKIRHRVTAISGTSAVLRVYSIGGR